MKSTNYPNFDFVFRCWISFHRYLAALCSCFVVFDINLVHARALLVTSEARQFEKRIEERQSIRALLRAVHGLESTSIPEKTQTALSISEITPTHWSVYSKENVLRLYNALEGKYLRLASFIQTLRQLWLKRLRQLDRDLLPCLGGQASRNSFLEIIKNNLDKRNGAAVADNVHPFFAVLSRATARSTV